MPHTHNLIEAKISTKATKLKQREKRYNNIVGFGQLLLCFFLFAFQLTKLFYNVCLHVISKWTIENVLSFSLTPSATAYNNNNVLTLAILKYKSPFQHIIHAMQFWPGAKHSTNNASSVRSPYPEDFIFPCFKIKSRINKKSK